MDPVQHLHSLVRCLTDTPKHELPKRVINITDSLLLCRAILFNSKVASFNNKWSAEAGSLKLRFQKLLSSFLHSASADEQWTASYLLKYIIDFDDIEELQNLGEWAKGLLALFTRPSTLNTIKINSLAILTRIFILGKDKSRLLRDITTYLLPKLITICIDMLETLYVSISAKFSLPQTLTLLEPILLCFSKLIPCHPTLFRSSKSQLHKILIRIIAPVSHTSKARVVKNGAQNIQATAKASSTAMRLYVQLHYLAPKNDVAKEWLATESNIIEAIPTLLDYLKINKGEELWPISANESKSLGMAARPGLEELGFLKVESVYDAESQLLALVDLLRHFLATANLSLVEIRLAPIIGMMQRLICSIGPSGYNFSENRRLSIDDAPIFLSNWCLLYGHVIKLAFTILSRFGLAAMSLAGEIMHIMTVAFERSSMIESLRHMFYTLFEQLVQLIGPAMTKSQISLLHRMITSCCYDILFNTDRLQQSSVHKTPGFNHADTLQSGREKLNDWLAPEGYISQTQDHTRKSAVSLLGILLSKLPADLISSSMRSLMERTAVLSRSRGAMLASTLNRPSVKSNGGKVLASPLPFLARLYPGCLETEGLLRPRVPILPAAVNGKPVINGTALLAGDENKHASYASSNQAIDTSQLELLNDIRQKRGVEDFENDFHSSQKRARHYDDKTYDGTASNDLSIAQSNVEGVEKNTTIHNGISLAAADNPTGCPTSHTNHDYISTGENNIQSSSNANELTTLNSMTTSNTTDTVSNTNTTTIVSINKDHEDESDANIPKTIQHQQIANVQTETTPAAVPSSTTVNDDDTDKNNNNNLDDTFHTNSNPSAPTPATALNPDSDYDSDDSESFTIPPLVMSSALLEQLAAADSESDEDDEDNEVEDENGDDPAAARAPAK